MKEYNIDELFRLWEIYHGEVHTSRMIPCDANPGDDCSVIGFLEWLKEK